MICGKGVGTGRLVDDHAHAVLAVSAIGLGAVQPDWVGVVDGDGEHIGAFTSGDGLEARVDAIVAGKRLARLLEGRLDDRVVPGEVVELDLGTWSSLDDVGGIGETALADVDTHSLAGGYARGGCRC